MEIYSQEYCNTVHNVTGGRYGTIVQQSLPDLFQQSSVFCCGGVVNKIIELYLSDNSFKLYN